MNGENLAYAAKANGSVDVERPDFGRILETLQKEASFGTGLVDSLTNLSNGIKNMDLISEKEPEVKEKPANCLVDYLWDEVWKIRRSNSQLERVLVHLQRTIGN